MKNNTFFLKKKKKHFYCGMNCKNTNKLKGNNAIEDIKVQAKFEASSH